MLCRCSNCLIDTDMEYVSQDFVNNGEHFIVDFLKCPLCKHVDIITIKDKKACELGESLKRLNKRINGFLAARDKPKRHALEALLVRFRKKQTRYANMLDVLKNKFCDFGHFTMQNVESDGGFVDVLVYNLYNK